VRVRLGRRCRHTSGGGSHQHWSRSGWTVDAVQLSATFARLSVRGSGLVVVDIAIDVPPGHPPVVSIAGPTFDLEELAGRKLVALFDRAEARDFADLDVARRPTSATRPAHSPTERGVELGIRRGAGDGNRTRVLSLGIGPERFRDQDCLAKALVRASGQSQRIHRVPTGPTPLWHGCGTTVAGAMIIAKEERTAGCPSRRRSRERPRRCAVRVHRSNGRSHRARLSGRGPSAVAARRRRPSAADRTRTGSRSRGRT
jgi:hypothetical protein